MTAWASGQSTVSYSSWQAAAVPGSGVSGCLSQPGPQNPQARLSARPGDRFLLAVSGSSTGPVVTAMFLDGKWSNLEEIGQGTGVEVYTGRDGRGQFAWCGKDYKIHYLAEGANSEILDSSSCTTRPALVQDAADRMHAIFSSEQLTNNFGVLNNIPSLVEMIQMETGWTQPALVARVESKVMPSAVHGPLGELYLVWNPVQDGDRTIVYSSQPVYECTSDSLPPPAMAMLDVIENGVFHPADYRSPFCNNRFDGLIYMPDPAPGQPSLQPGEKNGFDQTAKLLPEARYEVLFSNMQWDPDEGQLSPGFRLAEGVAQLYQKVKADPQAYPRGMTVRILLGNYPNLATMEYGDQVWGLVDDLAEAGVDTMEDPSIGWKLEVANYAGTFPHSHTKFAVIDGKSLLAAGFNVSWFHLPKDNPSGKGENLTDLGLLLSGPVAQAGTMVFDDLWKDADQVVCTEMVVNDVQSHCNWKKAVVSHTPEVLRYSLTDSESAGFAIYRTGKYKEADDAYVAALSSAKNSIDALHVSFSADLICLVNLIEPGVCDFKNALPYMDALVSTAEQNGTQVRVIVENANMNGLENRVGLKIPQDELAKRGISDLVELRYFDGRLHAKSALIDGQLLIIGSQNFHYSSFGEGGLLEFDAATTDPQAIEIYQKLFEYYWERAIPAPEASWGS